MITFNLIGAVALVGQCQKLAHRVIARDEYVRPTLNLMVTAT